MYNQFPTSFGQQQNQSQYRGSRRQFQPTGAVQSFYKSNPSLSSSYGSMYPQTQSYHASNYVGNQPGHDASQRADSQSPSSYHMRSYVGNQPNHDLQLRADSFRPTNAGWR